MQEFTTLSVSSSNPSSLATQLGEHAAQGWSVVSIVPTMGDVTAFLVREAGTPGDDSSTTADLSAVPDAAGTSSTSEPSGWGTATSSPVAEPAGWGTSPAAGAGDAAQGAAGYAPAPGYTPAPAAAPAVPAGWYADPAGRFELRYWDGSAWTEHVSRAGQQYTDPPRA